MTTVVNAVHDDLSLRMFRAVFDAYPEVNEHEFATAYVNFVERTNQRPSVWYAMKNFAREGVIA